MISYYIDLFILSYIFLYGVYVSYKSLKWGFFYTLLFVPLMHKELFSFVIWDLLPVRVAIASLALVAFIKLIIHIRKNGFGKFKIEAEHFIKSDPFLILLGILWVVRGLSIYRSEMQSYSFELFAFFSVIIAFYVLFKYLLNSYKEAFYRRLLYIYFAIAAFTGIFALIQYSLRLCCRKSIGGVWVVPNNPPRLGSTFWDVNHFGGFLITVIPIMFAYMFAAKKLLHKALAAAGLGFLLWLLFMTQSRSAWIGLSVGMSLSLLVYYWNHLRKPLALTVITLALAVFALIGYTTFKGISIHDKIANYMHYRLDSTDTHIMLLEGSTQIFFNNMVIGSGYGGFDPAFRKTDISGEYFDREPLLKDMKVPPHSVWGEILGETGGIGIVIYGLIVIFMVAGLITSSFKAKSSTSKYLGIGLLGSVIALFAGGLFYSYNIEFYWVTLFLAIGYIFTHSNYEYDFAYILKWWYKKKITPYLIFGPVAAFYIFLNLGTNKLIDYDEAIYAKVAKNILITGDWFSLHWDDLNSFWFEKPPLYIWLTALTFKLTNFNAFGARLASAVFGLLGIILIYKFGEKMYNKLTGIFAALVLISVAHYLYYSRNGMMDITVTFFILGTVYAMYLAFHAKANNVRYAAIGGALLGLGVMTKAVIGLLPIPILGLYYLYLIFIKKEKISFAIFWPFTLVALLVAAPWHIYMYMIHGQEFLKDYFLDQILSRGFKGLGHSEPLTWFLVVIKVAVRVWLVPFLLGIVSLFFIDKHKRKEYVLLTIATFFVFVFFSMSKDKLQWYIMPIYPFMALIAARFMERFVYLLNFNLKKEAKVNDIYLRSIALFGVFLISVFYIPIIRNMIYYPDANKDKVALVEVFNNMYPKETYPDRRLYFTNVAPPVLLFYSDQKVKGIREDEILSLINDALPNENKDFLLPDEIYYDVIDKGDQIKAPLVLDIKGSAGGWVLVKSKSRIDVINDELNPIKIEMAAIKTKIFAGIPLTFAERAKLAFLEKRNYVLTAKLAEYGYSQ